MKRITLFLMCLLMVPLLALAEPDSDGDGFTDDEECAPSDPLVYPGAPEICNGIDDNCVGDIDTDTPPENMRTFFVDQDGDGLAAPDASSIQSCEVNPPSGYAWSQSDCDDADPLFYFYWVYPDRDLDGFGDSTESPVNTCSIPRGYADNDLDCNDQDPSQTGGNSVIAYIDADGDGYGYRNATPATTRSFCDAIPKGWSALKSDFNDNDYLVRDCAGPEICDGIDNDCDFRIDEDFAIEDRIHSHFADRDGDGFGVEEIKSCAETPVVGFVSQAGDCDDADMTFHHFLVYPDTDGDGFGDQNSNTPIIRCRIELNMSENNKDCADDNLLMAPNQNEVSDGLDNDCNGLVDDVPVDPVDPPLDNPIVDPQNDDEQPNSENIVTSNDDTSSEDQTPISDPETTSEDSETQDQQEDQISQETQQNSNPASSGGCSLQSPSQPSGATILGMMMGLFAMAALWKRNRI